MGDWTEILVTAVRDTVTFVDEFAIDGFVAVVVLGAAASWAGVHLVTRRMPLVGLAVPQAAGAGQALAFFLSGYMVREGEPVHEPDERLQIALAGAAALVALSGLAAASRRSRSAGALAGIVFLGGWAAREILLLESPHQEVAHDALGQGGVLTVDAGGRDLVIGAAGLSLVVMLAAGRRLAATAVDPDQARSRGVSPSLWLVAALTIVGVLTTIAVPIVGPEVVLAFLLVPPTILRGAAPSLRSYAPLAATAGVVGAAATFLLSIGFDWPVAPSLFIATVVASLAVAAITRAVSVLTAALQR